MNFGTETEYVEFKESTSQTSRALEALAAMLNKHGKGKVLFGVDDQGEVIGQQIGNKTIKDLSDAITTRIKPAVVPYINTAVYDGKMVISVEVEGDNKPYSADGEYRIRSGNENRKIDPELLKNLVFTNSAEQMINIESFNQDLTFNQLRQLYVIHGLSVDPQTFEKNTGLLCRNNKYNLLADILSDGNDVSIKVVIFSGYDKTEMVSRNEYGYRCLLLAMQSVLDYVNALNETRVIVNGDLARHEIELFDESCFREAWVNACLHTNWVRQIPPAVYLFKDRMEVVSTGGLPADYSTDDFYKGISHPINRQLQKIMGQLGYVEQTGHGVPLIIGKYGKEAFSITENHIVVTLRFPFEMRMKNNNLENLTASQKQVYLTVVDHPLITIADISKVTGMSTSTVSNVLRDLKELNRIERIGSRKTGYWKIVEQ